MSLVLFHTKNEFTDFFLFTDPFDLYRLSSTIFNLDSKKYTNYSKFYYT